MEINRLAKDTFWSLADVFRDALVASGAVPGAGGRHSLQAVRPQQSAAPTDALDRAAHTPGASGADRRRRAGGHATAQFGALRRALPGYEFRPPQVHMLESVAGAFNQAHHLMAEAGTGTGKSVAYLLPAIAYTVKNGGNRVVVSTNTINLQDQLFKKDLPDLQRILERRLEHATPFRAALLKGRSNYMCRGASPR